MNMKRENRDFLPVTPGEILEQEFLKPMELSQYRLAEEIHVPARRITETSDRRSQRTASGCGLILESVGSWPGEVNLAEPKQELGEIADPEASWSLNDSVYADEQHRYPTWPLTVQSF
jgi:hypothetical protein